MAPINPSFVASVSSNPAHGFSKPVQPSIRLLAGLGVEGDAHMGVTVRHRYLVRKDPTQPNLCQVHLLHDELFAELIPAGFTVLPGQMGENITTHDLDLLSLATGTLLALGDDAVVEITGLRTPCSQIDKFQPGLMRAVTERDSDGRLICKAGIMAIVTRSGEVKPGDSIRVTIPPHTTRQL